MVVLALLCTGCKRYYLTVSQQIINRDFLASTHVGTPDPRQAHPPLGRRLIVSWQIPDEVLQKKPHIELDILYWNYTEGKEVYAIDRKRGYVLYTLVDQEFVEKEGLLSYKAKLVTEDGKVYRKWKQQLWVDLIKLDDEEVKLPQAPAFPERPK